MLLPMAQSIRACGAQHPLPHGLGVFAMHDKIGDGIEKVDLCLAISMNKQMKNGWQR